MSFSDNTDPQVQKEKINPDTSGSTLFTQALTTLPNNKPLIFTNLLRFHKTTQYPSKLPDSLTPYLSDLPTSTTGAEAYWTRYFPVYDDATRKVFGDEAERAQRVVYKGAPLMPLRYARREGRGSRVSGGGSGDGREEGRDSTLR